MSTRGNVRRSSRLGITALAIVTVVSLLGIGWAALGERGGRSLQARLATIPEPGAGSAAGFARAEGPRAFDFPADHGPHLDFQTEWWYYTGNLEAADGRHFGYQLTFFRRGLVPPGERQQRPSSWATEQVYMAHFAITDVAGQEHCFFERFSRGAAGLAGAEAAPYRVWLENWRVTTAADGVYYLQASQDGWALELQLVDRKGPLLQGEDGYSRKGADPGNASYYISQTRLETTGAVTVGGTTYLVDGSSWMDHEFSTSALAADQVGWDWFALQLDDGRELMLFHIRTVGGDIAPYASGTLVETDGSLVRLGEADFSLVVQETWRSPHSGAVYPARWTVTVPAAGLALDVAPYVADQELVVSFVYWEGAVQVGGTVAGSGYVELTGYAGSMAGQF
ncbi:MAG: carotenoid 1,2-hydratase [Anaerolineae bacterium]|nr:carotenoid 1,2-hydratase [Anaerolineae bacterium]